MNSFSTWKLKETEFGFYATRNTPFGLQYHHIVTEGTIVNAKIFLIENFGGGVDLRDCKNSELLPTLKTLLARGLDYIIGPLVKIENEKDYLISEISSEDSFMYMESVLEEEEEEDDEDEGGIYH